MDWAFIGGTSTPDQVVRWPLRGTSEPGKIPGAREGGIFFNDDQNNMWIGLGISWMTLGSDQWMPLNDIWSYNLNNSKWFWKTGIYYASDEGTYPNRLDPGSSERNFLASEAKIKPTQWHDRKSNQLYFFGGWSVTTLNNAIVTSSRGT